VNEADERDSTVLEDVALLALQRQGVPWVVPGFLADLYRERFGPDSPKEAHP
jgi:hypothetical protein